MGMINYISKGMKLPILITIFFQLMVCDCISQSIWQSEMGSPGEMGTEIFQKEDTGFLVCSVSLGFPFGTSVIKTNAAGDTLWTKHFLDSLVGYYNMIEPGPFKGIFMLGNGLLKLDEMNGDTIWFNGSLNGFSGVITTSDSGFIF